MMSILRCLHGHEDEIGGRAKGIGTGKLGLRSQLVGWLVSCTCKTPRIDEGGEKTCLSLWGGTRRWYS